MPSKTIGEKLKELRKERGYSLVEVGAAVGLSHNFLSEVERGKKEPSSDSLQSLAKFYQINEDDLFLIMNKLPPNVIEHVEQADPYLQKLVSEVQRRYRKEPNKIEAMRVKITKMYEELLNDEDD